MPLNYPAPTVMVQALYVRASEVLMRSYPVRDSPLNIRPAMVFLTASWLILLGVLGMAPLPELPINDKALHFFGLGFATFLIYFMIEAPEGPARRVWFVRRAPLMFTLFAGFLIGGIVSEFVQSLLPWKTFQLGDIIANLLGSSLFLYLAVLLNRRIRRRQEIASLYQPLGAGTARSQGYAYGYDEYEGYDEQALAEGAVGGRDQNRCTIGRGLGVWDIGDDEEDADEGNARLTQGERAVKVGTIRLGPDEN